jgi:hypothetical protein
LESASQLNDIFCNKNQIGTYVVSFHDSVEALQWGLCIDKSLYHDTYEQFIRQYGRPLQLKVGIEIM